MTQDWDSIYEKYQGMLTAIAHRVSMKYQVPFEDLLAEGIWGAWSLLEEWDEKRCSLGTWVYRTAYHRMLDYSTVTYRQREQAMDMRPTEDTTFIEPVKKECWVDGILDEVGEEAKALINVILEAPEELHKIVRSKAPAQSKRAVQGYMVDVADWPFDKVQRVWREVETALA